MGAPGSVSTIDGSTMQLSRTPIPCPELTIFWICWPVSSGSLLWTLQVSLSQEARVKTAFATHSGLFQFKVMPFGLCNAPATFERLMDRFLQGLRWSRCLIYLDDIISFGSTFRDALDSLIHTPILAFQTETGQYILTPITLA